MEIYAVDEVVHGDASGPVPPPHHVSPAIRKTLVAGGLCNDAIMKEDGTYVGHSTDVALQSVLSVFGMPDPRQVRPSRPGPPQDTLDECDIGLHTSR